MWSLRDDREFYAKWRGSIAGLNECSMPVRFFPNALLRFSVPSWAWSVLLCIALLLVPGHVSAGGFEIPGQGARDLSRGGAFIVKADDPTAVLHNPGALVKLDGTHIFFNHTLIWHFATFTRSQSRLPDNTPASFGDQDPFAPVSNESELFPLGAFFAATTDFGLKDWTFGISAFGPNSVGKVDYPTTGGQRYMMTGNEITLVYFGLSAAYGDSDTWGVGATVQYAYMPTLKYELVVDATNATTLSPYASATDVKATIDASDDFAFTAIVGGWWRPIPQLEVGVSGRVVPVYLNPTGSVSINAVPGQTQFTADQLSIPGASSALDVTIAPSARVGARYRHLDGTREIFDVELNVVYEAWNLVEAFDTDLEGEIQLFAGSPIQDISIDKRWRDTVSVRLGGTWNAIADLLGVSLGAYYESGAMPQNYTHVDYLSLNRYGLGGGFEIDFGPVDLSFGYTHVFQNDVTVSEEFGKVIQQRPINQCPEGCEGASGVIANAGTFQSSYDLFAASVRGKF